MQILISHAVEDEPAASAIKELIRRCSLNRIDVWFSSDNSSQGGMPIGGPWFGELQTKLKSTHWVVALATRSSLESPWLYFECGFAAANKDHSVVPVVVGLPISELPMPLAAYQVYDATNAASLANLTQKLLEAYGVIYDEEMTKPVREHAQRRLIGHLNSVGSRVKSSKVSSPTDLGMADLKNFIEQRFKELYNTMPAQRRPELNLELRIDATDALGCNERFTLNIPSGSSLGDALDEVYFRISDRVQPFTFLLEWTLVEEPSGRAFSVETLKRIIPASTVLGSGQLYSVKLLNKPDTYLRR